MSLVTALVGEIAAVCVSAGYSDIANGLDNTVQEVIESTAANRSSMLQDVEAGRPTEIDYITGYLLRTAEDLNLDTPANRQIYREIKSLG